MPCDRELPTKGPPPQKAEASRLSCRPCPQRLRQPSPVTLCLGAGRALPVTTVAA